MISKTTGFRGTQHFQTPIYGGLFGDHGDGFLELTGAHSKSQMTSLPFGSLLQSISKLGQHEWSQFFSAVVAVCFEGYVII